METKGGQKGQGVRVLSMNDNQCVWMKAGVVNYKICENAFDCTSCAFDKAISRKLAQKPTALVSWKEVMRQPHLHKECRHMLTGRVLFKLCSHNFECKDCAYDQQLCEYDQLPGEEDLSAPAAAHLKKIAGFAVADDYYYHQGHSWARIEHGGFARLGVDDFAWRLLGWPTDLSLPKIGTKLRPSEKGWSIKREDHTAEVLSPMSGVVMVTNQNALRQPDLAKKDPYGKGWLVVIDPVSGLRSKTRKLLFEQEAVSWLNTEAKKLDEMVMSAYGVPLAATGGEIVDDIYGNLPDIKWEDLVHTFLHT
ncbi:MAG: glycine cleavage system protein H [Desulfobaccales bacterium]